MSSKCFRITNLDIKVHREQERDCSAHIFSSDAGTLIKRFVDEQIKKCS